MLIFLSAIIIGVIVPWAPVYIRTAQTAAAHALRDRELARSEFATTADLREKVEFLYGKYVNTEAKFVSAVKSLNACSEEVEKVRRELREKGEALATTEKEVRALRDEPFGEVGPEE